MTRSEQINDLAAALASAQAQMHGAKKDSENPHFRSRYADLASVVDACREALTKNGLSVLQSPRLVKADASWVVELETTLLHKSGQFITDTAASPIGKPDAQGVGSAVTYLRRYALAAFAGVAPEDDDAEGAVSHETRHAAPPVNRQTGEVYEDAPRAAGALTVRSVTPKPTKKPGVIRFEVQFSDGSKATTISERLGNLAIHLRDERCAIKVTTKETQFGTDLVSLVRAAPASDEDEGAPPLDDSMIPF